jgi:hypothetical protein
MASRLSRTINVVGRALPFIGAAAWLAMTRSGVDSTQAVVRIVAVAFGSFALGLLGLMAWGTRRAWPEAGMAPRECGGTLLAIAWLLLAPSAMAALAAVAWEAGHTDDWRTAAPGWVTRALWIAAACGAGFIAGLPMVNRMAAHEAWRRARRSRTEASGDFPAGANQERAGGPSGKSGQFR